MSKLIRIHSCSDCIHCCYGTWDHFCKLMEEKGNQESVPYRSPGEYEGRKYPNGFFPIPEWCPLENAE